MQVGFDNFSTPQMYLHSTKSQRKLKGASIHGPASSVHTLNFGTLLFSMLKGQSHEMEMINR